jgi:hypothetical protein
MALQSTGTKGAVFAPALAVNIARHDFLARTALSQDHHSRIGGGGPTAFLDLLQHDEAAALEVVGFPQSLQPAAQDLDLFFQGDA